MSGGEIVAMEVAGNYAYVTTEDHSEWPTKGSLHVVDISDPENPRETGIYKPPGTPNSVSVSENYAYVTDGYAGLRVVDVSNPNKPKETGYYDTFGYAQGVAANGNHIFVADEYGGLVVLTYLSLHGYLPLVSTSR
jgi:hypothetical protein